MYTFSIKQNHLSFHMNEWIFFLIPFTNISTKDYIFLPTFLVYFLIEF